MAEPIRFTDLRELILKVQELEAKVAGAPQADPEALLGQVAAIAMAVVQDRVSKTEQRVAQFDQRFTALAEELRAAIPPAPDFASVVAGLSEVAQLLREGAARVPADPPGLATLSQGMNSMLKMMGELCAQLEKPVVREGVADLPSGQVKLRITETRTR